MREHEVPTHVQAEDKVLLWLTFPQIVAVCASCAFAYGVFRYAPVGPFELRLTLAAVVGLAGVAAAAGSIGGRRLPLVVLDLLRYRFGARVYAGSASELVRAENPDTPDARVAPLARLKRSAGRAVREFRRRRARRRRSGRRMPFRPRAWLRARRIRVHVESRERARRASDKKRRRRWTPRSFLVAAFVGLLAAAASTPPVAYADGGEEAGDEAPPWTSPEIQFQPPPHVPGRRVFFQRLEVRGDTLTVGVRAAHGLDLGARAFRREGDPTPLFQDARRLARGASATFAMPIAGPSPSFVFSWRDDLGQSGAVALEGSQIPHPLPESEGDLCSMKLRSLRWTPGSVRGDVETECVRGIAAQFELDTVAGHVEIENEVVIESEVTAVVGNLYVEGGGSFERFPLIADDTTPFDMPIGSQGGTVELTVTADLLAELSVPVPPLVSLAHHPERTEKITGTVTASCPGASKAVSKTVRLFHPDGTETSHTLSGRVSVPAREIEHQATLSFVHLEHVRAEIEERPPETRVRREEISIAAALPADDPFAALVVPPPPAPPEKARHETAPRGLLGAWFDRLGWSWPW